MSTRSHSLKINNKDLMKTIAGLLQFQTDILSSNSNLFSDLAGHIVEMRK